MSRSYFTEDQKMAYSPYPAWTFDESAMIRDILYEKGYFVNIVARVGCDRHYHDAWLVQRRDIGRLIEQLFRQRIVVEVQAEGHGEASINFCYDYEGAHIIRCVKRFHRNKQEAEL